MTPAQGKPRISRRTFLQSATLALVAQAPALQALVPQPASRLPQPTSRLAWVAGEDAIHCFRRETRGWLRSLSIACEMPSALALHLSGRLLYVAHGKDSFAHRPSGSVSCYRIGPATGDLTLLRRQGLSLACVQPDSLAVSPLATMLVVASAQAGMLNVLPLDEHGLPGRVTAVRRQLSWNTPVNEQAATVELRFAGDETFVATRQQMCERYRCTIDEISVLPSQTVPAGRAPRDLPDDLRNAAAKLAGARQRTSAVLL